MIRVNVIPAEFRQEGSRARRVLPSQKIFRVAGIIFLALTSIFYIQYWIDGRRSAQLQGEWARVQQDVRRIEQIRKEMEGGAKAESIFLEKHVLSSFPATNVLNWVSEFIPEGAWLTEMRLTRHPTENGLILKGVAIASRSQSSVQKIEAFLRMLKEKFPSDTKLILTTTREQKERRELTLFTAAFKWA